MDPYHIRIKQRNILPGAVGEKAQVNLIHIIPHRCQRLGIADIGTPFSILKPPRPDKAVIVFRRVSNLLFTAHLSYVPHPFQHRI